MRDLQNIKQRFHKPFADFLIRWRAKLAQMKHRPSENDQLMIAMEGCVLLLSKKLKDLGIQNFEELYRFGVQKESDLAQERKSFIGRPSGREGAGFISGISSSSNM